MNKQINIKITEKDLFLNEIKKYLGVKKIDEMFLNFHIKGIFGEYYHHYKENYLSGFMNKKEFKRDTKTKKYEQIIKTIIKYNKDYKSFDNYTGIF